MDKERVSETALLSRDANSPKKGTTMDTETTNKAEQYRQALQRCSLSDEDLCRQVEAHLSPELRAQLLQADLALAAALHELVELERSKQPPRFEGEAGLKVRATLYPERTYPGALSRKSNSDFLSGSLQLGSKRASIKAWIGSDHKFINLEISLL
jgi:hypothetical protein